MTGSLTKGRAAAIIIGAVIAATAATADDPPEDLVPLSHETVSFRDQSFQVIRVNLKIADLRMYWQNGDGENYLNFARLRDAVAVENKTLAFACNAGIYNPEIAPAGLHVEDGKRLHDLNTREGQGNFHLMPNGVFYIAEDVAHIVTTETYHEREPSPRLATQSGPMLVIDGEIHPKFNEGSDNRRVRSGVGVVDDTTVIFAISTGLVNFFDFASLFRDRLGCDSALYLDGDISAFYAPRFGLEFEGGFYAGILAVVENAAEEKDKDSP
jgi:uncharacterized protein YigE (DUF2233 family)